MKEERKWTEEELSELKEKWNKMPLYKLAAHFHTNTDEIISCAKELNLEEYKSNRWTKEEENLLREYADKYLTEEIATKLGRSYLAVQKKANKLGIILHSENDPWEDWMIEYVKENINKIPIGKISEHIGLSYRRIITKCEHLGIEYIPEKWTEEEIKILREYAPKCHYTELTKVLPGRTVGAISAKAFTLGIETISDYKKIDEDIAKYIKDNWGIIPATKIAQNLKLSLGVIYRYKKYLNLPNLKQNKKWTAGKIKQMKKDSEKMTRKELAKKYHTSVQQISSLAKKHNFKLINSKVVWTKEKEEELIKLVEENLSIPEISEIMNIKGTTIRSKIKKMGLSDKVGKNPNLVWTEEEIEKLKELSKTKSSIEIATILNKTEKQVTTKASSLGIELIRNHRRWTEEETNTLLSIYDKYSVNEIARKMNRSDQFISKKMDELNLPKKFKRKSWTEEEVKLLIKYLDDYSINEISVKLNRTTPSITAKLKEIKMKVKKSKKVWSEEEVKLLTELVREEYSVDDIADKLNKTHSAVLNKMHYLGLKAKKNNWKKWTVEEEQILIDNADKISTFEIAKILGKSEEAVTQKAHSLGIPIYSRNRPWTTEEEETLSDLWGSVQVEKIADKLNRTPTAIINRAFILGLESQINSNYEGITINEIANLLNTNRSVIMISWVNLGLKINHKKRSNNSVYSYVTMENLLDFLEKNQDIWDSRNLEKNILGYESDWLIEKRKNDMLLPTNYYKNVTLNKQQLLKENNYYLDEEAPKQKIKKKNEGENNV